MKTYHYTYRILNIIELREYIGARSCGVKPEDDLGIGYFSSSKDQDFINDQKNNPSDYRYKIISCHPTRKSAVNEEIQLHNFFDIAKNPKYYNRAKQTSEGFDTTGFVSAMDTRTNNSIQISKYDFEIYEYYVGATSGSTQTEESNNKRSKTTSKTKIKNAVTWNIFDNKNVLRFTAKGNLMEICKINNLPYESLRASKNNTKGLYNSNMANPQSKWMGYKGWTIMEAKPS